MPFESADTAQLLTLLTNLTEAQVRFVMIGVGGANYYAMHGGLTFTTRDRDLFLPSDPQNERRAWEVCEQSRLQLWSGDEPLGQPLDDYLARKVVEQRALVTATGEAGLVVDLTLVMAGFEFDTVWAEHRTFVVDGVEIPVARLAHIVESKRIANREKDRLFLTTHAEALRQLFGDD